MGWVVYKKTWDLDAKMLPRLPKRLISAALMVEGEKLPAQMVL